MICPIALTGDDHSSRTKELFTTIKQFLELRIMNASQAAQLRGRFVFANSQTSGKLGAMGGYAGQTGPGIFFTDDLLSLETTHAGDILVSEDPGKP